MSRGVYVTRVRTRDDRVEEKILIAETFAEAYDRATRGLDSIMIEGAVVSSASDPENYTIYGEGA